MTVSMVFRNEYGTSEFAFQLVRDAKGMTDIPHQRPKHAIYEGKDAGLLFENGMLFHLAFFIAREALTKQPNQGEDISIIPWKETILDKPFYPSMSRNGVERAGAISKRIRDLGFRAGYVRPPRPHEFRAGSLMQVAKFHTEAERRKQAAHRDSSMYDRNYASNLAADGQGAYFNGEVRGDVMELFRDLSIPWNPSLWQAVPAEKREEFENSKPIVEIRNELASLQGRRDTKAISRQKELYQLRRRLESEECRKLQKLQPRHSSAINSSPCYYRCLFNRIRFLMAERDRLATTLFQNAQASRSDRH
ncbi:hypothetical protein QBC35DRAFT_548912 [Podospora australis]|uniref:Uncharacterized protein n=1 Tax=Podospora australis TaxID=1536484 RepID=A0AAN6WLA6_9PEZI|nr:hypothetical protein QBC35DRAFT_548912 [Podospora australis]